MEVFDLTADSQGAVLLGSIIKHYRRINRVDRATVAQTCNLSVEYIRLIETGKRTPVRSVLGNILEACRVTEGLFDWSPDGCDLTLVDLRDVTTYGFNFVSRIQEPRRSKAVIEAQLNKEKMDLRNYLIGVFDIHLSSGTHKKKVNIVHWMMTSDGRILYLVEENGSIYNFDYIVKMVKHES